MSSINSTAEVNLLIYHYLKESDFRHACFSLRHESRLDEEPLSKEAVVEPGRLLKILQKGLVYMAVEAHVNPDGSEKACSAPFHLVGPPHVCDGKARRQPSAQPEPQRLTPEPRPEVVSSHIEAASQTDPVQLRRASSRAPSPIDSRPNGKHTASNVASSSKDKLDAEEPVEASTSKRKASASNGSSREEKRSKKTAAEEPESTGGSSSAKRLPNGARHQDTEEKGEDEEGDVTPRLTATAQNGKASSPSPPNKAKGKKASEVAAGGKVGSKTASSSKKSKKKKQKRSGTAENEDDEDAATRSDAEEVSTSKNPRKVAGAAIASNSSQPAAPPLTGKAKGKEIASDDITTLVGHSAEVFSSAWNPTVPGLIASAGGDATVRIWDLPAKGASPDAPAICKHLPTTHAKDVSALEWNPDGTLLASGSYDGILRLWTPQGDLHLVMSMHQGPIFSVKWNRKGTMLLTSSADGTAIVWDLSSGKVRQQFPVHSDGVLDVDWLVNSRSQGPSSTRNDMTFATASADNSINLCRVGEMKPIRTLRGHDDEVNALRFDASQTLLASASDDKTTRIWSIDGNVLGDSSAEPSSRPKRGSAGLPKGRGGSVALDASASMDVDNRSDEDDTAAEMRVGSSNSGSLDKNGKAICQFVLTGHTKEIYNLQWAPTGPGTPQPSQPRMLATASFDKTARIWNAEDGTCLRVIEEHSDCVYSVCWSPDARFLATGSIDRKVLVNRVKDGGIVKAYVAGGPVFDVTWHVSQPNASSSGVAAIKGEAAAEEGEGSEAAKRAKSGGAAPAKGNAAASSSNGSASGGTHQLGISQADKRLTILDLGRLEEEKQQAEEGGEQATQGDKTKMEE